MNRHHQPQRIPVKGQMVQFSLRQRFPWRPRPFKSMNLHLNNEPRTSSLPSGNTNNKEVPAPVNVIQRRNFSVVKSTDCSLAIVQSLQDRIWQRDSRDRRALQPDYSYAPNTVTPSMLLDNTDNAVTTRFVKSIRNIDKCSISCLSWTPQGRRLITASTSGEFTVWDGLTFKIVNVLQASSHPVNAMLWTHNDIWMVIADSEGYVKYWQPNMNYVKMFRAHEDSVTGISFSPSDQKFVTGSADGKLKVWDFNTTYQEKVLRGHGDGVTSVDWHPYKGLVLSGSIDSQQPVKLWDPRSGVPLSTLHVHKISVTSVRWNRNGNWFFTASKDGLIKLFDVRKLPKVLEVFRGHKKGVACVSWHPIHERLFASGGFDGSLFFWNVGYNTASASIKLAHIKRIVTLAWHPVGHVLCSGSTDGSSKFWTRHNPGEVIQAKVRDSFLDYGRMMSNGMEEAYSPIVQDPLETHLQASNQDRIIPCLDLQNSMVDASINADECLVDVHPSPNLLETESEVDNPSAGTLDQNSIPLRFRTLWYNVAEIDNEEGRNPCQLTLVLR